MQALALLEWQIAMGADEAIGEIARDWLSPRPPRAGRLASRRPARVPPAPSLTLPR